MDTDEPVWYTTMRLAAWDLPSEPMIRLIRATTTSISWATATLSASIDATSYQHSGEFRADAVLAVR